MAPNSQAERLAAVEQRITDHESRCEERLVEIKKTAGATLLAVEGLKTRIGAVVLALLAWALVQLWTAQQAAVAARPSGASAYVTVRK